MAAAVDQQPRLAGGDDRAAEIDAGDRAAGALADRALALAVDRHDAGRPAIALLQPAGDDADHAGMPAAGGGEDQAGRHARLDLRPLELRDGRGLDLLLDLAALGIVAVQAAGEFAGLDLVLGDEEPGTQPRLPHPAAGIDPRAQQEARVIAARRLAEPRHIGERRQAGIAAPRHHLQPLGHQSAIDARQRHHVADRPQGHQIEPALQIGLGPPRAIPAGPAQGPVDGHRQQEGDAHGGELAMALGLVEPVGIDHRDGLRAAAARPHGGRPR